jgi:TPR repeat protein
MMMKHSTSIAICVALALCACSNKDNPMPTQAELSAVRARLAFTCVNEADHSPPLDPQVDALFQYALFLEKKPGPKDYDAAARYYRIASAYGHYKANHNLQLLVSTGQASSPYAAIETIDLAEKLIAAGVPGGYYDMGHYLEVGYGVKQDEKKALAYFRKAADLGSPEAQDHVGDLLAPVDKAPEIALEMHQCAANQGYGPAATTLGMTLKMRKQFTEAVAAFQKGVAAGDTYSALFLENGFAAPPSTDPVYYLALPHDPERTRRYKLIGTFLDDNDGLNPKLPDIDRIVPVPPARLPEWDGTFQWQKEQDAAKPTQKPDDKLVERLAKEKNLAPATGLPLAPAKTAKDERVPLGTVVRTGEVCPQDGIWCDRHWASVSYDATRRFRKGETMPQLVMDNRRPIPFLDTLLGMRKYPTNADWSLVSYDDQA